MLLDALVPDPDAAERHRRDIAAPVEAVWESLHALTLGELPLVGLLFALRSGPARLARGAGLPRSAEAPLLAQMLASGFQPLGELPLREVAFGAVGQPWRPRGGLVRVADAEAFSAFAAPGYARMAMDFRLEATAAGTRLSTETRVALTDAASRRAFGRYWLLIRPGSGLIRRLWLRGIARRAEAG